MNRFAICAAFCGLIGLAFAVCRAMANVHMITDNTVLICFGLCFLFISNVIVVCEGAKLLTLFQTDMRLSSNNC